jgi:hypothetical protein
VPVGRPLTIRQSQLEVLSHDELRKFERWMVAHVVRFFPRAADSGESQLLDLVRHGIRRAAAHGITTRPDVCKYVDLMMVLGRDFDTDAGLAWAAAILEQPSQSRVKIAALRQAVANHVNRR